MSSNNFTPRRRLAAAFTLLEAMIAVTIGVTMMGLAALTSVDLMKNFTAAEAFRNIHDEARRSMERLSRDIRSGIAVTGFPSAASTASTTNEMSLSVMSSTDATNLVRYYLANNKLMRDETVAGVTTSTNLTDNVTSVQFTRYARPGQLATTTNDAIEIRVSLTITNSTSFRTSTDLLQARVMMRNKTYP